MMSDPTALASPDVLCKAIKDVIGLEFNPQIAAEVSAAGILVEQLLDNTETAQDLAQSVARHYREVPVGYVTIVKRYQNVQLRTVQSDVVAGDPFQEDYPSESSAEEHARIKKISSHSA